MLESPAFRTLSRAAHQVLARVEIEHAHHGGKENGELPVTYGDFERYGVHLRQIAPAIRELVALGFVEVTQRGCAGNAECRRPNHYRLTYRHRKGEAGDGSHEWKKIETIEQAEAEAEFARQSADPKKVARGKKQNPTGSFRSVSLPESDSETTKAPPAESASPGSL